MLSERSHEQKDMDFMTVFLWNVQNRRSTKTKRRLGTGMERQAGEMGTVDNGHVGSCFGRWQHYRAGWWWWKHAALWMHQRHSVHCTLFTRCENYIPIKLTLRRKTERVKRQWSLYALYRLDADHRNKDTRDPIVWKVGWTFNTFQKLLLLLTAVKFTNIKANLKTSHRKVWCNFTVLPFLS